MGGKVEGGVGECGVPGWRVGGGVYKGGRASTVAEVVAGMGEVDVEGAREMRMAICVATMMGIDVVSTSSPLMSVYDTVGIPVDSRQVHNNPSRNLGVVGSYERMYRSSPNYGADVLAYVHDDLIIHEQDWGLRVLAEFEDPKVGIVGFGGAIRHGSLDLYKVPYRLQDLARFGYMSNVDDAEVHGERMEGSREVAVLDGFALCIRRSLLDRVGGWSTLIGHCDFYGYDYAACGLARRLGYSIRVVGVRCHHLGGRTSTGVAAQAMTGQDAYDKAHRWFYEEFRDVMPWEVPHVRS